MSHSSIVCTSEFETENNDNKEEDNVATIKYINGEISFEEYTDILEASYNDEIPATIESTHKKSKKKDTPSSSASYNGAGVGSGPGVGCGAGPGKRPRKLDSTMQGLMGEANVKLARGEYTEAIKMCMEVIRQCPKSREPFTTLSMIYEEMGDGKKALQYSLIGGYLSPRDKNLWMRLVDLSLEQNDMKHALDSFEKVIRADPYDFNNFNQYSQLLMECDLKTRAAEVFTMMLTQLESKKCTVPKEDRNDFIINISKDLTDIYIKNQTYWKARKIMDKAFEKCPHLITAEDVNIILELNIQVKDFYNALKGVVINCGVSIILEGDMFIDHSNVNSDFSLNSLHLITRIDIPEELPIDIMSKLVVVLIHLSLYDSSKEYLKMILASDNIENIGDLILDITEAYMVSGQEQMACPLLEKLVQSTTYDLMK